MNSESSLIFILFDPIAPNGLRYLRVGGTRQRCFAGTRLEPRKRLENAQTPTRRVHAVLGALTECQTYQLEQDITANLTKLLHTIQTLATDKKHDLLKLVPTNSGSSENATLRRNKS
jgi:hypothetical protein